MIEDDNALTWEQRHQMEVGQNMALSAAVHALIATHPNPAAYAAMLDHFAQPTNLLFLERLPLQKDDGIRRAYGEALHTFRSVIPTG